MSKHLASVSLDDYGPPCCEHCGCRIDDLNQPCDALHEDEGVCAP